ncbi:MAG: hypothetical protein R3D33_04045 [Hyphomicrobiaceae bacterium]
MTNSEAGRMGRAGRVAWCFAGLLVALVVAAAPATAGPLQDALEGSWSGYGWLTMAGGEREKIQCSASYGGAGTGLAVTLRCVSVSYSLDGRADLTLAGGRVDGAWSERSFGVAGSVSGRAGDRSLSLILTGPAMRADVGLTSDRCKQTLSIDLDGTSIRSISVGMRRC